MTRKNWRKKLLGEGWRRRPWSLLRAWPWRGRKEWSPWSERTWGDRSERWLSPWTCQYTPSLRWSKSCSSLPPCLFVIDGDEDLKAPVACSWCWRKRNIYSQKARKWRSLRRPACKPYKTSWKRMVDHRVAWLLPMNRWPGMAAFCGDDAPHELSAVFFFFLYTLLEERWRLNTSTIFLVCRYRLSRLPPFFLRRSTFYDGIHMNQLSGKVSAYPTLISQPIPYPWYLFISKGKGRWVSPSLLTTCSWWGTYHKRSLLREVHESKWCILKYTSRTLALSLATLICFRGISPSRWCL